MISTGFLIKRALDTYGLYAGFTKLLFPSVVLPLVETNSSTSINAELFNSKPNGRKSKDHIYTRELQSAGCPAFKSLVNRLVLQFYIQDYQPFKKCSD